VLKDFIQSLGLATLKPDKSFIAHVESAFAYSMKTCDAYVIYMEPMSAKPTKFSLPLPNGNYKIEWMDVTSGKIINTDKIKAISKYIQVQCPTANNNDKVLKLTTTI
jgi:hypothetical protein